MTPRFVIQKGRSGGYHVQFKGSNGEIVFWTESYTTKQSAERAIAFARQHAATAPIADLT